MTEENNSPDVIRESIQSNTKQLFDQFKIYDEYINNNLKIEGNIIIIKTELDKNKEYYLKVKI